MSLILDKIFLVCSSLIWIGQYFMIYGRFSGWPLVGIFGNEAGWRPVLDTSSRLVAAALVPRSCCCDMAGNFMLPLRSCCGLLPRNAGFRYRNWGNKPKSWFHNQCLLLPMPNPSIEKSWSFLLAQIPVMVQWKVMTLKSLKRRQELRVKNTVWQLQCTLSKLQGEL